MRLPAPDVPIELQLLQQIADDVAGLRADLAARGITDGDEVTEKTVDGSVNETRKVPADGERVTLEEPVRPDPAPDAPKAPAKPAAKKAQPKKGPASGGAK